jgi:carbamoyl-phosphate synthase large subunit
MNVLITAASRRVALVEAFQSAVRAAGRGRVVVTDVDPSSPAVHVADVAYRVPFAVEAGYVGALLDICVAERIGLVVPTIDDELESVASARDRFDAAGAVLACSVPDTAALCNDKHRTCAHLSSHGIPAAASWLPTEVSAQLPETLFVKPRVGRGSVGAFPIRNRRELAFFLSYVQNPVIQEFLAGPEYTIDMLCDWEGRPLSIVPRERTVIRAGVSDRGRTVKSPALESLAASVAAAIPFRGPVNVQCRMRGDTPVVIEINPRFSGGISLTLAAGADFPAMLIQMARGRTPQASLGQFRPDVWMTNFERALFLPAARLSRSTLRDCATVVSGVA